jgi:starvation-inducible DNA-binding protein
MDKLIEAMKVYFSTNFQYYTKAHGYHVNVVGPDFYQYHKLFEKVYDDAQDNIDNIAEEIRTLQAIVPFSTSRISKLSKVSEADGTPTGLVMVKELLADTEIVCETIREAHGIAQTENCYGLINYLEGRLDDHYKIQWMLRSTLGK